MSKTGELLKVERWARGVFFRGARKKGRSYLIRRLGVAFRETPLGYTPAGPVLLSGSRRKESEAGRFMTADARKLGHLRAVRCRYTQSLFRAGSRSSTSHCPLPSRWRFCDRCVKTGARALTHASRSSKARQNSGVSSSWVRQGDVGGSCSSWSSRSSLGNAEPTGFSDMASVRKTDFLLLRHKQSGRGGGKPTGSLSKKV